MAFAGCTRPPIYSTEYNLDFEYAKQAIQYNIISYMLKPLTMDGLAAELKSIHEKIDARYAGLRRADASHADRAAFLIPLVLAQYDKNNGKNKKKQQHNPYQCGYRRYKRSDTGFHRGSGEPWRRIIHDIHIIRRFGRNMIVTGQRRWFKNRITDRQSETREAPEVQECPVKWNSMIFRASFCSKIFSDIESVSETVSL